MNYSFINRDAQRVEAMIPSMTCATLVDSLGRLTRLGIIAPGNSANATQWKPVYAVVKAVETARLENKAQPAPYRAW